MKHNEELKWLEEMARQDAEEIMKHKSPYSRNPLDDMDDENDEDEDEF